VPLQSTNRIDQVFCNILKGFCPLNCIPFFFSCWSPRQPEIAAQCRRIWLALTLLSACLWHNPLPPTHSPSILNSERKASSMKNPNTLKALKTTMHPERGQCSLRVFSVHQAVLTGKEFVQWRYQWRSFPRIFPQSCTRSQRNTNSLSRA